MTIWYCASEAAPLIKIGGLGDVAGSLPKALSKRGLKAYLIIPHYDVIDNTAWNIEKKAVITIPYGKHQLAHGVSISAATLPNSDVPVILLGNEKYLTGGGINAFEGSVTEADRYAFFSKAITALLFTDKVRHILPFPDIVNCNDWHTSLVPLLVKIKQKKSPLPNRPAFVLTIHNLKYQGISGLNLLDNLGIKVKDDDDLKWEVADKDIDILLEGILHVDVLNTVSENYSREIITPEFSEGLGEILDRRKNQLFGILNGIDYSTWNPEKDTLIAKQYSISTPLEDIKAAKSENKLVLQQLVGLPKADVPLIGFIGRIEPMQKGMDIIHEWLERSAAAGRPKYQCVILGKGDPDWEKKITEFGQAHSDWFSALIKFDEPTAHAIYAGCDYILMPSKFEPGGLPQMIAQRYGTPPIVHAVGGLKDTVTEGITGLCFASYSSAAMEEKIAEAIDLYGTDHYWQIAHTGMKQDYSWEISAEKYAHMYEKALTLRNW